MSPGIPQQKKLMNNGKAVRFGLLIGIGLALSFLAASVIINWRQVSEFAWELNIDRLIYSWLLYSASLAIAISVWGLIVKNLAGFSDTRKNIKYYCLSSLGRLIPGNLWYAAGRAYLYEKEGIAYSVSSTALILELCLLVLSSLLVYIAFLPFLQLPIGIRSEFLAGVAVIAILIVAKPSLLQRTINFFLRRFKKGEIKVKADYKNTFAWLGLYSISWILGGGVLYTFISAIHPLEMEAIPAMVAMSAISGLAGMLAFLVPGGLGLKDATLAILLTAYLPLPVAVVASLLYRLWLVACEVIWLAISSRI